MAGLIGTYQTSCIGSDEEQNVVRRVSPVEHHVDHLVCVVCFVGWSFVTVREREKKGPIQYQLTTLGFFVSDDPKCITREESLLNFNTIEY